MLNDRKEGWKMNQIVKFDKIKDILIVRLFGELDHHVTENMRNSIDNEFSTEECKHLLFDCTNLQFMDSSGLGMILGRYKKVSVNGGKVVISSIPKNIEKIMELSGIFKILSKFNNEKEAIDYLGGNKQ